MSYRRPNDGVEEVQAAILKYLNEQDIQQTPVQLRSTFRIQDPNEKKIRFLEPHPLPFYTRIRTYHL